MGRVRQRVNFPLSDSGNVLKAAIANYELWLFET